VWYNKSTEAENGKFERRPQMLNTKEYLTFINNTIALEGYKIADTANKLALEANAITNAQYSKAARLIVEAYLHLAR
jgi:hypothetical protein